MIFIFCIVKELEIKKINNIMSNKIYNIRKTSNEESIKKLKPIFEYKEKSKGFITLKNMEIKKYNNFYLKQIRKQRSFYNNIKWKKDYDRSQFFKKYICEFPIINFYGKNQQKTMNGGIISINKEYKNYFDDVKFKQIKAFSEPKNKNNILKESEKNKDIMKKIEKSESSSYSNSKDKNNSEYNISLNNHNIKNKNNNINKSNSNIYSDKNSAKKENNLISLKFIKINNKKEESGFIISCRKNILFSDIIDKLMNTQKNLDINKIKGFTIKKTNLIIDLNKTIEENKIEDNSHIIINM